MSTVCISILGLLCVYGLCLQFKPFVCIFILRLYLRLVSLVSIFKLNLRLQLATPVYAFGLYLRFASLICVFMSPVHVFGLCLTFEYCICNHTLFTVVCVFGLRFIPKTTTSGISVYTRLGLAGSGVCAEMTDYGMQMRIRECRRSDKKRNKSLRAESRGARTSDCWKRNGAENILNEE